MQVNYSKTIKHTARAYMRAQALVDFDSTPRENIRAFFELMRFCCETKNEPISSFLNRQQDHNDRIQLFA